MSRALAAHDAAARNAVDVHRGDIVKLTGDGMLAIFADPGDALNATLKLLSGLADTTATHGVAMNVRCGLHCGVVERRDRDVFGTEVNRAARIMSSAHGGQVLLSQRLAELIRDRMPTRAALLDLGTVRLRDLAKPEQRPPAAASAAAQGFPGAARLGGDAEQPSATGELLHWARIRAGRSQGLTRGMPRLLTLVGAGGLGKTRLRLAGRRSRDGRVSGWRLVRRPGPDPGRDARATGSWRIVLGVKEEVGRPVVEAVVEIRQESEGCCSILDNCEHLVDACARARQAAAASRSGG